MVSVPNLNTTAGRDRFKKLVRDDVPLSDEAGNRVSYADRYLLMAYAQRMSEANYLRMTGCPGIAQFNETDAQAILELLPSLPAWAQQETAA